MQAIAGLEKLVTIDLVWLTTKRLVLEPLGHDADLSDDAINQVHEHGCGFYLGNLVAGFEAKHR
ncbi:MAG: hypothetical protein WBR29_05650 [Gammaproteobacteria bacterium]